MRLFNGNTASLTAIDMHVHLEPEIGDHRILTAGIWSLSLAGLARIGVTHVS